MGYYGKCELNVEDLKNGEKLICFLIGINFMGNLDINAAFLMMNDGYLFLFSFQTLFQSTLAQDYDGKCQTNKQ